MHIINGLSNSYNLYSLRNTKSPQKTSQPVKSEKSHSVNFKGRGNLLSDVVWGSMFLKSMGLTNDSSRANSANKKNHTKNDAGRTPVNVYDKSEQSLNTYLRDIKDVKCEGNKISLTTAGDVIYSTEIPKYYFEGVENKEKLVKQWLVDSRENHYFNDVPIELMKLAKEMRFYYVDNVNMYVDLAEKAARKGVELLCYDSDGASKVKAIFKIDGEEYKFKLGRSNSLDSVLWNSAYYDNNSYYQVPPGTYIKNIKDLKAFVTMKTKNGTEVSVPALKNGVLSSLEDINLVKYGNIVNNPELTANTGAAKTISNIVGKKVSSEDISVIKYMTRQENLPIDFANNEAKLCYGYYDESTKDSYVCVNTYTRMDISDKLNIRYSLDCNTIYTVYKKDKDGKVEKFNCADNGRIILSDDELEALINSEFSK